jgi:GTP-binding protein
MADGPGLVEGAAEGRGLGHRFLRHVERARVLLVLVDLAESAERSPADQLAVLLGELERYQPELVRRPRVVAGSRADLGRGKLPTGVELGVSAVTGAGVPALLGRLAGALDEARAAEDAGAGPGTIVIHRPLPEGVRVERMGPGSWALSGRAAERAVGLSDLTDDAALDEAVRRLGRLGVDRALGRAGARDGDLVSVGAISFTWFKDPDHAGLEPGDRASRPRGRRRGAGRDR